MGRKKLKLDENKILRLAEIFCTREEIAHVMDCHVDTLRDNYDHIIKKGQDKGKSSLRRHQFALAKKNAAMAIWLGKQYLGQQDVPVKKSEGEEEILEDLDKLRADIKSLLEETDIQ